MRLANQHHFIHGKFVASESAQTYANIAPATGETLCQVDIGGPADVARAVESAVAGQLVWAKFTGAERGRILHAAAQRLRAANDELAHLEVLDTGKPIAEAAVVDVVSAAECLEYFAGVAPTLSGTHHTFGSNFAYTRREPLGVCVGIGAWNYPLQIAAWKAAPALACGNAMVFKPSELTPLTALRLAQIFSEAGLPDGVFNVVLGDRQTGALLCEHPRVAKVSLTGSVETGKKVAAVAASTLKHVTLELGGKSPLIICDDANLDSAVTAAMLANFYTQGEICSNGTRVFVHESIYDTVVAKLLGRVAQLRVGNPLDPKTHIGALISSSHRERVLSYIATAQREGATLLAGGQRVTPPDAPHGYFVAPTVFGDCSDEMTHVREEIFGPVMSVLRFQTEDEVLRRANQTPFGLSAGVFTRDLSRAHRMIASLEAGTCWINTYNITPVEIPFGGYKQSGMGRENGLAAIEHYSQVKSVYVEMGEVASPYP